MCIYMAVYRLFRGHVPKRGGPRHSLSRVAFPWPDVLSMDGRRMWHILQHCHRSLFHPCELSCMLYAATENSCSCLCLVFYPV